MSEKNRDNKEKWLGAWKKISTLYLEHPVQRKIYGDVSAAIDFGGLETIIAIIGPTRIGKTSLIKKLLSEKTAYDTGEATKIIYADAKKGKGNIAQEYKRLAISILEAAEYPGFFIPPKMPVDQAKVVNNIKTTSADTMWSMVKRICKEFLQTYIVVDEAHLLVPESKESALLETQMTELKKIAEIENVKVILTGGYRATEIFINDDHANGRSDVFHFRPYGSSKEDKQSFNELLKVYDKYLDINSKNESLRDFYVEIWNECLGNVGLLHQLIGRICRCAHALDRSSVDSEVIVNSLRGDSARDIALSEYQIGESYFGDIGLLISKSGQVRDPLKNKARKRGNLFKRRQVSKGIGNIS